MTLADKIANQTIPNDRQNLPNTVENTEQPIIVDNQEEIQEPISSVDSMNQNDDLSYLDNLDDDDNEEWNPEPPSNNEEKVVEKPAPTSYDFTPINKVIGKEIKSMEEFEAIISDFKKTKELDGFANETIREANEIAKQGGDFLSYLQNGKTDYSAISDNDLVLFSLNNQFGNEYSQEELLDHIQEMNPIALKQEAARIRQQLEFNDTQRVNQIKSAAKQKQQERENLLINEIKATNELHGRKLSRDEKTEMYHRIKDESNYVKYLFYENGKFSPKKAMELDYIIKNYSSLLSSSISKGRSEASREFMEETSNVSLPNRKGGLIPSSSNNGHELSSADKIIQQGSIKRTKIRG